MLKSLRDSGSHLKCGKYEDLVHPILIYADLLATGNERNIETAKMIYDKTYS